MRVQEGLCVLGAWYLICQDLVNCYFLLCFIASWTWEVVSVMLYTCMLCVALLMCLFVLCVACLTVFVNCLVKQFAMYVGVVAILLLNVMDVFSVCGGALLDRPCMVFQRVCVLCLWSQWASKCSFHMFCLCFCMSEVISSFRSLRVDIVPRIISNILKITLQIIDENTNTLCKLINVNPDSADENGILIVHWFGDHYNGTYLCYKDEHIYVTTMSIFMLQGWPIFMVQRWVYLCNKDVHIYGTKMSIFM